MSSEGDPTAVRKSPQWAALWPVPLVTHCSCTGAASEEDTLGCGQWKCLGWLEGTEDQGAVGGKCRGRGMNGDARKRVRTFVAHIHDEQRTMSTSGKTEPGYRNGPAGRQPASLPWINQCSSHRLEYRVTLMAKLQARHRLNNQGAPHPRLRWWMPSLLVTETKAIVHPPRLNQIPPVYQPAIRRHLGKRACILDTS